VVKLVMLMWVGVFENSTPTREDNVPWLRFKGAIYKSNMRFQMVLFLFE
jgi:hypothetical protein